MLSLLKTMVMKALILVAILFTGIVACNSPKPATSNPDNDTTMNQGTQGTDTLRRDSIPLPK